MKQENKNMAVYNAVRVVPKEAQKEIKGGKLKGMTDINPMWRIQMLTEQFGMCGIGWYTEVINKWVEPANNGEAKAFVEINLYVKVEGEWSKPIYGIGGSSFGSITKNGLEISDECYKMAYTDAISVACKALGFGADIYWAAGRTEYSTAGENAGTEPAFIDELRKAKDGQELNAIWTKNIRTNEEYRLYAHVYNEVYAKLTAKS